MKFLKISGFFLIILGMGVGLYQSYLLILSYLYNIFNIDEILGIIRPVLISLMLIGFFLIILGGPFENYLSGRNKPISANNSGKAQIEKHVYVIVSLIGLVTTTLLLVLIFLYQGFWVPFEIRVYVDLLSIAAIIWLATSLPLYVDKINRDTLEINLFGIHFHETFLGILFIITGFLFILHHKIPFDFVFGSYYLIIGSFLMGRDIEDLRKFKIIERVR